MGSVLNLTVANIAFAVHTSSDEWAAVLRSRLVDFLADDAPTWHVTLTQVKAEDRRDGLWVAHDERGTRFQFGSYQGYIDLAERTALVQVEKSAVVGTALDRVLAYICMQELPRRHSSLLLHAAGLVLNGHGLAFAGRSDAGKTTTARLAAGHADVLGDDTVVVSLASSLPALLSTPFWGAGTPPGLIKRCNRQVPLRALLMLEHGQEHELLPLTPGAAVMALLETEKVAAERVASADAWLTVATNLVERVPAYSLRFKPTADLWPFLVASLSL